MDKICLCPIPENVKFDFKNCFSLNENTVVSVSNITVFKATAIAINLLPVRLIPVINSHNPKITVTVNDNLEKEEYTLKIGKDGIHIEGGSERGCFYAFATLRQIMMQAGSLLPFCEINDSPRFKIRGYLLDVARNKIPTLERLKDLADTLCLLKINHLELYFETAPFEYKDYPDMWQGYDVLTHAEFAELDSYCKERFIELVPTQNTFGHMGKWLYEGGYSDLAECPNGFVSPINGEFVPYPLCLDPTDEQAFELVKNISDDLLSVSSSNKYNVCCDETIELGCGKSKELCEKYGKGQVYFDYLMKLHDYCSKKGKTMMFWADIINEYPQIVPKLPKDVIALNWGYYDNNPSEESCINFEKSGIPYCICPGTAAWNTMTGNIPQMLDNIRYCVTNGDKHNALGVINTEWGDCGHWQGTFSAYPGLVYGAAMSWRPNENKELDIPSVLNKLIFEDKFNVIGDLFMKVGSYVEKEATKAVNTTITFRMLQNESGKCKSIEKWTHSDIDKVKDYLSDLLPEVEKPRLYCKNGDVVVAEIKNSLKFLLAALDFGHYSIYLRENDEENAKKYAKKTYPELAECINEFVRLWTKTNRISYLMLSIMPLIKKRDELLEYTKPKNTPPEER